MEGGSEKERNGGWVREGEKWRVVRVKEKFSNLHALLASWFNSSVCVN